MSQEYERNGEREVERELIAAFAATFIPRWDTYSFQLPGGDYLRAKTREDIPRPLTLAHVERHLKGQITLGAYMLAPDNTTDKIAFDADDDEGFAQLYVLKQALAREGITSYLELSRRGGHLWLFTPPLSGHHARKFGKQLLRENHIEGMELYPKQERLTTAAPIGSLVRLPLGIHRAANPPQRYPFITLDGEHLADNLTMYLAIFARPDRVPAGFIDQKLALAPEMKPRFLARKDSTETELEDRIRSAISTYDFVSQYVELTPTGRGYCPFHDDQRMSFSCNKEGDYWHCFAECGRPKGGDLIHFWIRWREVHGQSTEHDEVIAELMEILEL